LVPPGTPRAQADSLRHRGNRDMSAPSLKNLGGHFEAPHLENWLRAQRWFAGKARPIGGATCRDRIRVGPGMLYVVFVGFTDVGEFERYLIALRAAEPTADAFDDAAFCRALLDVVRWRAEVEAGRGEFSTGAGGTCERVADVGGVATLAVLQEYVGGARDGWRWLLDRLAAGDAALDGLRRLGTRTAELHAALATPTPDPAFGAETITPADVAAWADGVRRQVDAAREAAHGHVL